ncbi:DUF1878 family protein [Bacillus sp. PS06]|uniref:DUF1878 family protein n=1 Tax=Bacillus sp. PS06 TaxID=2764176 RepID=UPI00177E84E3|nr:DUF1878 family protein [Bacillus sp. PS06]MBD8067722.1 DUF1878 family protein [Bacillus sp. PS06]
MESFETRISRLEYYQRLLFQLLDEDKIRFYKLIVESNLQEWEVDDLFKTCELLSKEYKKQKAEGLVIFTPLLTQFINLLHPNLKVEKTVEALLKQGLYIPLMTEFDSLLKKSK